MRADDEWHVGVVLRPVPPQHGRGGAVAVRRRLFGRRVLEGGRVERAHRGAVVLVVRIRLAARCRMVALVAVQV